MSTLSPSPHGRPGIWPAIAGYAAIGTVAGLLVAFGLWAMLGPHVELSLVPVPPPPRPEIPMAVAPARPARPSFANLGERGGWLFENMGCIGCHGPGGRGGVPNPNSIRGTVPRLADMADQLMLFDQEDAELVIARLEKDRPFQADEHPAPFRTWPRFVAKLSAVHRVIEKGNPAGIKEPGKPPPPLNMPSWEAKLSRRDIDALIVWLIERTDWDEDE